MWATIIQIIKYVFLIVGLISINIGYSNSQWKVIGSIGVKGDLYTVDGMQFCNSNNGILYGSVSKADTYKGQNPVANMLKNTRNFIAATTDSGKTWHTTWSSVDDAINSINIVNGHAAYALKYLTKSLRPKSIMISNNCGQTWKENGNLPRNLHQIYFDPEGVGIGFGLDKRNNQMELYKTSEGSLDWKRVDNKKFMKKGDRFLFEK